MTMTVRQLEDAVQIHAWGRWARPRIGRMLGTKAPAWTWVVPAGSGWGETQSSDVFPHASDEHCEAVDRMIASMGQETVAVMVALYCYRRSLNAVAKAAGLNNRRVMQLRDCALNQIYGAMYLKNIA